MAPQKPLSHSEALEALRSFLKDRSSYDVFPVSFRLIVLDSQLKVKKALDVMLLYGGFRFLEYIDSCLDATCVKGKGKADSL